MKDDPNRFPDQIDATKWPKPFPHCSVCQAPGLGQSALCEEHQPKAPEWNDRWSAEIPSDPVNRS